MLFRQQKITIIIKVSTTFLKLNKNIPKSYMLLDFFNSNYSVFKFNISIFVRQNK